MRYRDLPAVHYSPSTFAHIKGPADSTPSGLFLTGRDDIYVTFFEEGKGSVILDEFGTQIDLRPPNRDQFRFPRPERFSDGRWLVVESRTSPTQMNAFVFNSAGTLQNSFYAGDGIETVLIDRSGKIWLGYFDEGVFGAWNPSPARDHPSQQYGPNGLVRLDDHGKIEFAYNDRFSKNFISDIYALTLDDDDRAWFCPYIDFFLASAADSRVDYALPRAPVSGAHALSIGTNYFVFFGGYRHRSMITVVERSSQRLRLLQLRGSGGNRLSPSFVATRGPRAIALADDRLYRLDQDTLLEVLGPWNEGNTTTIESATQYLNEEESYSSTHVIFGEGGPREVPGKPRPSENQPRDDEDTAP